MSAWTLSPAPNSAFDHGNPTFFFQFHDHIKPDILMCRPPFELCFQFRRIKELYPEMFFNERFKW